LRWRLIQVGEGEKKDQRKKLRRGPRHVTF
jgi:hypothetical protein